MNRTAPWLYEKYSFTHQKLKLFFKASFWNFERIGWKLLMKVRIISTSSFQSQEIKENAARYIKEIADVLAFVNRQMILIFKTNDLLRNIEFTLGTQSNMTSFVQMSRACMKVLRAEERRNCQGKWCLIKNSIGGQLDQLKISFYQFFLILWWSRLGRFGRWIFGCAWNIKCWLDI